MTETAQAQNGQVPAALRPVVEDRVLGWDDLSPRDLLRAKAAKLFGETDPQEAVEAEPLYATALVIWCVKSREDPAFTWDQALDSPYSTLKVAAAPPPPPARTPSRRGAGTTTASRAPKPAPAPPAPASAPSSVPSST